MAYRSNAIVIYAVRLVLDQYWQSYEQAWTQWYQQLPASIALVFLLCREQESLLLRHV
jgi:hypothetical protein